MISSAEEFVKLRASDVPEEYGRAAHDEAPIHVWLDVVARFPDMRQWVAHNKTVPLEVLEILSRDSDPQVRYSVACKRKLSRELFDFLAKDTDESVRHALALNRKVPLDVLKGLAKDPIPFVRDAALERLKQRDAGNGRPLQ